jgi:uncharacterized membrane protein
MRFRLLHPAAAGLAAAAVTATAGAAAAAPAGPSAVPPACAYRLDTRLPIPVGEAEASVTGTDGTATFIGSADDGQFDSPRHAVVWRNGRATELPTPAKATSIAEAINHGGDVVGFVFSDGNSVPVLWRGGQMITLAHDPKDSVRAEAINDAGVIVGTVDIGGTSNERRGVTWTVNAPTSVRDIPVPAAWGWGSAASILTDGTLVADIFPLEFTARDAIGIGTVAGVRVVPGPADAVGSVEVRNAAGGYAAGSDFVNGEFDLENRAVRWKGGVPETLSPKAQASASGVNSSGTTVGDRFGDVTPQAVVWTADGTQLTLPVITTGPVPVATDAGAVTEDDSVGGSVTSSSGLQNPVVWHCR